MPGGPRDTEPTQRVGTSRPKKLSMKYVRCIGSGGELEAETVEGELSEEGS